MTSPERPDPNNIRRQLYEERVDEIVKKVDSTALLRESEFQGNLTQIGERTFFIHNIKHSIINPGCNGELAVTIARLNRTQQVNAFCDNCGKVDVSQEVFLGWLEKTIENHPDIV